MASKIQPISGFPEYLPAQQLTFNRIVDKIRQVYQSFGYTPLETPAIERIDILTSKGIDSKEVYALRRLNTQGDDDGAKELALRFDLTVPTARYVAQHYAQLVFPFRRHQIQPVWRGERPKKGRERQFYQCDIDFIADGAGNLPLHADAEIIACAAQALSAVLPENEKFTLRVNNRKLLQGLLTEAGFITSEARYQAVKVVDDLEKISPAEAITRLAAISPNVNAQALLQQLQLSNLNKLPPLTGLAAEGLAELTQVINTGQAMLAAAHITAEIVPDLTIARGLDYYTGTVIETRLHTAPEFGSICSGGRYENLAESLSDRQLPGVGISIGLTRLVEWLFSQPAYTTLSTQVAPVFIACPAPEQLAALTILAAQLRQAGLGVEQSLQSDEPLGKQLQRAEKRGYTQAIVGVEANGSIALRTFATRQTTTLPLASLIKHFTTT
jgi:histidyl-tRNA synthetase